MYRRPTYLFALWFLVFATFPSSKRREEERETEREREGIAGVSATNIPFCAVVSCFCHLPLFKKKRRREKREYRVTYLFALWFASVSLRGVCVCVARETEREQEGRVYRQPTYLLRCGFLFLPPSPLQKEEKERDERISGDKPFRAVVCVCESTRCVRVCSERETEREQEGIAGVSASLHTFCAVASCFCHLPPFKKKRRRDRERENERE